MALVSLASAVIAVVLASRGRSDLPVRIIIAVALGAGFAVLVGAAAMSLGDRDLRRIRKFQRGGGNE